jgi:hypothetical protein
MQRRIFMRAAALGSLGLALAPGLVLPRAAFAQARNPADTERFDYVVLRNDIEVGRHGMTVAQQGDTVRVTSTTNIEVKFAMLTLYRFEQNAREAWRGDKLVEFAATTDDDGKVVRVEAKPRAKSLALTVNGKTRMVEAELKPASLWNPRLVEESRLFDTADGQHLNVAATFKGEEEVVVREAPLRARRYSFTGDMQRDIWYDAEGKPVQVAFEAKDGSEIKFVLA